MAAVVTAQAFELVDDDGNVRAALDTDTEGNPSLQLYGREGIPRVQLAVTDLDQANLVLRDKFGKNVLAALVNIDGSGTVEIKDGRGISRVTMRVGSDGSAMIALLETDTKAPVMFRLNADGTYDGSFDNPVSFDKPKLRLVPEKKD